MVGEGREPKKDNDLFYTCSLIDYIARRTKNVRADVVNQLGKERLERIYDLADVYHCDNIERVCDDFVEEASLSCIHPTARPAAVYRKFFILNEK